MFQIPQCVGFNFDISAGTKCYTFTDLAKFNTVLTGRSNIDHYMRISCGQDTYL